MSRTGRARALPIFGMALASAALAALGLVPSNMAIVVVLGVLTGLGFGMVMPVNQVVVQTVAGRAKLGAVTFHITVEFLVKRPADRPHRWQRKQFIIEDGSVAGSRLWHERT